MTNRLLLLSTVTMLVTACASTPEPSSLQNIQSFKSATGELVGVHEKQPFIMHNQASKAAFGLVGGIANVATANDFIKKSGLKDPAPAIEAALKSYISSQTTLLAGTDDLEFEKGKKPKKLPLGKSEYYIDASTLLWGINYFPANWASYQTYYTGDIKLLDGSSGEVLARNTCKYKYPETAKESPGYDELMGVNGEMFKANIQLLADRCIEEFKTKALGF